MASTPTTAPITPHTTGGKESKNPAAPGVDVAVEVVLSAAWNELFHISDPEFRIDGVCVNEQALSMFSAVDVSEV